MKSLGMIEVKGLVTAIEAADTALKAANVALLGSNNVGLGLISVIFEGEVAAVQAAVEAGAAAAKRIGEVVSIHVIPKPEPEVYNMVQEPTL